MEDNAQAFINETLEDLVRRAANLPVDSEAATLAYKNVKVFSEIHAQTVDPLPAPAPTTRRGRAKEAVAKALDNETTRTLIKAAASFGGVFYVAHATIKRDHVLERNALNQANQRPL